MLPTSKNWPHFKICVLSPKMSGILSQIYVPCHYFDNHYWGLRMNCSKRLRKVGECLQGKQILLGQTTEKLSEEKDGLLTLTGGVGRSSDLDPSPTPSCPDPHVPQTSNTGYSHQQQCFSAPKKYPPSPKQQQKLNILF